jgi:3-hydroxyisobutyrate dehydrogenase
MSISKKFIGGIGAALQMKALVNMVMNINTAALAEGLGLASFLGLDLNVVKEVFGNAGAASRVLVTDAEDMINREHEAFFTAAHAAKDCGIALDVARQFNVNVPLAQAAKLQYDKLGVLGLGHLDKSAISELTFKGRSASVVTRPVGSNTVTGAMPNIKRLS